MQEVDRTPITFPELLERPGVLEVLDLRGKLGFMAFHGGNLERLTEQIASEAAARSGSSFYAVIQPAGMRHHLPSTKVDPAGSARLKAFLDHCDHVIAVHGYGLRGHFASLLCGGQNRELAGHVAAKIRDAVPAYQVIDDLEAIPRSLRGMHPRNPCNLTAKGGMQLELPPRIRGLTPLVWYWPSHDYENRRFPHVNLLVDGLVEAALTWENASNGVVPTNGSTPSPNGTGVSPMAEPTAVSRV
ncbi:MAG: poly-gamma-glutamate hydrolase family protein, partial [Actinomycetota bacterium]